VGITTTLKHDIQNFQVQYLRNQNLVNYEKFIQMLMKTYSMMQYKYVKTDSEIVDSHFHTMHILTPTIVA